MAGESKFGKQYQSIDPSNVTNANVFMFPITPCASIGA
jgi:hypothetical protein